MGVQITRDRLARMFPRALPEWIDALDRLAPLLIDFYRLDRLDWCGIAGQIDAETDGLALKSMVENMRFSESRMLQVYAKRLGDCVGIPVPPLGGRVFASRGALARALVGKPDATADVVYGGPRGREGTPPWQGARYLGRGPLQCTHLDNYRASRDEIRRQPGGDKCPDLVDHPELLASDPDLGVREVFAQWRIKGLSRYARAEDWTTLSDVLNTGNANDAVKPHGLPRRLKATARALAIWPKDDASPAIVAREAAKVAASNITAADLKAAGSETVALAQRIKQVGAGIFGINALAEADHAVGLGMVDAVVGQAEHVKGLVDRSGALVAGVPWPSGRFIAFLAVAAVAAVLVRWAARIEWRRVIDAREGLHIGRISG